MRRYSLISQDNIIRYNELIVYNGDLKLVIDGHTEIASEAVQGATLQLAAKLEEKIDKLTHLQYCIIAHGVPVHWMYQQSYRQTSH